jgi:hypothetical protein
VDLEAKIRAKLLPDTVAAPAPAADEKAAKQET